MKKVIGSIFILGLFLAGCSTNTVETSKSTHTTDSSSIAILQSASSTNETTESTVVENAQESKSSQEILNNLTSDTNKKITQAFLDADLKMYGMETEGPSESLAVEPDDSSGKPVNNGGMTFFIVPGHDGIVVSVENFSDSDSMTTAKEWLSEKNGSSIVLSENRNIKSIMYIYSPSDRDQQDFSNYTIVFEEIE